MLAWPMTLLQRMYSCAMVAGMTTNETRVSRRRREVGTGRVSAVWIIISATLFLIATIGDMTITSPMSFTVTGTSEH
jgi:hypothetical protein